MVTAGITGFTSGKPFYNSTCYDQGSSANNGIASTATVAEFMTFDAVKVYYNNTLYATLDSTTIAKYGLKAATLTDFFKGAHADY